MGEVHIKHDIPAAMDFFALFQTTGWNQAYQATPQDLEQALHDSWYTASAYQNGELIGFGRVLSDGVLYAMIYDLIVHPDFQNQGLGSQLLNRLIAACQQANIRAIQLFSAHGKVPFYERRGFVVRSAQAPGMVYQVTPPSND
ncbi:GNAT family N-acetyltransferase [Marinicella meishanensis]|uniref:GNAT family N-acetyltransferase n=1 Tax=Marinicella meishanensis TaxID=2873263 RepID=UPI001CBC453F|nr:GNAT family N-acetyltransferase [Marinicella sp. NBU2979]